VSDAPNVLWLMTDEQRTDSLGCYGSPWAKTPALDALAETGVVFASAYTPAPVCCPARVSLLTGRYPCETGVWWNERHLKELDALSLGFEEAGYRTASFGKHHYEAANRAFETELEQGLVISDAVHYLRYAERHDEREFDVLKYPGEPFDWILGGRFPEPVEATPEAMVVAKAIEWLELDDNRPFFLRASFNAPHTPVAPPEPWAYSIPPESIELPAEAEDVPAGAPSWHTATLGAYQSSASIPAADLQRLRSFYYGQVAFADHMFDELLGWMRSRRLLENTIVAFVSDHGTHLGDFGLVQKQTFYDPVVKVPLFFAWSGVLEPRVVDRPVETRRLLPTLLDLCGLPVPPDCAPSLGPLLAGGEEPEAPVFSEFALAELGPPEGPLLVEGPRLGMVREGRWKLSTCVSGGPPDTVLTDLDRDPHERRNVAADPANRDVVEALARRVRVHLGEEEHVLGSRREGR
jgi:arylsulfatase A-like enzyme